MRLLWLLALIALAAPGTALAGPGDLDPSFAGDGVYAEFYSGQGYYDGAVAADIAVRPDGVSVMVGDYSDADPGSGCYARALNAEGVPEPSFASGGELMRRNLAGFACSHFKKIQASADSLYMIGVSDSSDGNGERVYKLNYAGELDTTWGDQGAYRCESRCTNLLVQESGAVIFRDDIGRVARLTPQGALDPEFGPVLEGANFLTNEMQLVDDRLYLLGYTANPEDRQAVVRTVLAADGAPSGDYGGDSELRLPVDTYGGPVAVDHQRRIIVTDSTTSGTLYDYYVTDILRRYTADGAADPSFGGDGEWSGAPHRSDTVGKLVIADFFDRILFTSSISSSATDRAGDQRLARINSDGTLDTEFGDGGYRELRSPSASWDDFGSYASRIVETPQGAIQVGGGAIMDGACCGPEGETGAQYVAAIWQLEAGADSCVLVPEDGGELPAARAIAQRSGQINGARAAAAAPRTVGRLRFGPVDAVGCFTETEPGKWVNNSPTIRINGVDFIAASGAIRLDSNSWAVSSSGAELRVGGMTFYRGPFTHDFSTARVYLDNGPLGKTFKFKGIALTGKASFDLASLPGGNGYSKLVINAAIPGTAGFKGFSVADAAVEITLQANNDKGLLKPSVKATLGQLGLGPFGVKDGSLTYDFAENNWTADALFGLPFPVVPYVGGSATIKEGHLTAFSARAETKIPIGATAFFLTGFNFGFSTGDDGKTMTGTGGATVAFGPPLPVPGGENGAISGATQGTYTSGPSPSRPGTFKLNGELKMVNVPLSEGHITMATDLSKVDFEGRAALHGKAGPFDLFNAEGKLFGWFDSKANWQAQGNVQNVRFLKWQFPNGQALASSKGMGVCVAAASGAPRIGFGYDYRSFSAISDKCDVGRWATLRGKATATRSAEMSVVGSKQTITVAESQEMAIYEFSAGSAPEITVKGPGLSVKTPASGSTQTAKYLLGQSEAGNSTYLVLIRPRLGRYTVSSSQRLTVRAADVLPDVDVKAHVSGTGAQRTLTWSSTKVSGQTIRFLDSAESGERSVLLDGAAASGSHAFAGGTGEHTITAIVERAGAIRAAVDVARYGATPPPPPARVTKLRAKRVKGKLRLTWRPVVGAARYEAVLKPAGTKELQLFSTKPTATLKLGRRTAATATVTAIDAAGQEGAPARIKVKRG